MEQTVMNQANGLLSLLVPVAATLLITAIPGFMAIFSTMIHVNFWRRDNRASGGQPYSHNEIRDKVYLWGKIYGGSSVILLQGLVEMLLKQEFNWYMRGSLLVVGLFATGPVTRVIFDLLKVYAEDKGQTSKHWAWIYNYIAVHHRKHTADDEITLIP